MTKEEIEDLNAQIEAKKKRKKTSRWYARNLRSLIGNDWAMFYCILGGRMTGKSYALTDFLCNQKKKYNENVKNYWIRISETSTKALLANKANKLVDPDLVRKYDLELTTKGMDVYNRGAPFMTVLALSGMAKMKGVAFYDKDFKGTYNIVLDEFQLEQGEKRTSFDILYNFIGMIENIIRTTKTKVRILKSGLTTDGYPQVALCRNSTCKYVKVHILVAKAFLSNPENKPTIDHVNTVRHDNRVCNLRYFTFKEQMSENEITKVRHGKIASECGKKNIQKIIHKRKVKCITTG